MKLITQKYKTGCGVAAVAMVANIKHDHAIKLLFPKRKKYAHYATTDNLLISVLSKLGFKIKNKMHRKITISNIKHNAILIIKYTDDWYHYVVWDHKRKLILDPGIKIPVTLDALLFETGVSGIEPASIHYQSRLVSYLEIKR